MKKQPKPLSQPFPPAGISRLYIADTEIEFETAEDPTHKTRNDVERFLA